MFHIAPSQRYTMPASLTVKMLDGAVPPMPSRLRFVPVGGAVSLHQPCSRKGGVNHRVLMDLDLARWRCVCAVSAIPAGEGSGCLCGAERKRCSLLYGQATAVATAIALDAVRTGRDDPCPPAMLATKRVMRSCSAQRNCGEGHGGVKLRRRRAVPDRFLWQADSLRNRTARLLSKPFRASLGKHHTKAIKGGSHKALDHFFGSAV